MRRRQRLHLKGEATARSKAALVGPERMRYQVPLQVGNRDPRPLRLQGNIAFSER